MQKVYLATMPSSQGASVIVQPFQQQQQQQQLQQQLQLQQQQQNTSRYLNAVRVLIAFFSIFDFYTVDSPDASWN
jgi:type II secretory ATPase GspE/PulE/Tfp pilus assembly ATPase PilB-like protein